MSKDNQDTVTTGSISPLIDSVLDAQGELYSMLITKSENIYLTDVLMEHNSHQFSPKAVTLLLKLNNLMEEGRI